MIFVGLFVYLYEGYILAQELIWYTISLGVVGYLVWERSKPDRRLAQRGALDGNPDILAVANLAGVEDVDALDGLGFDMGVVVGAADGQHPFGGL